MEKPPVRGVGGGGKDGNAGGAVPGAVPRPAEPRPFATGLRGASPGRGAVRGRLLGRRLRSAPVVWLRAERSREPRTAPSCPHGCGRRCYKTRRARSCRPRGWIWPQEVRGARGGTGGRPPRTARTPPPRTASTRLSPRVLGWFFFFSLLAEKKKPTSQLPFGVTEPPPLRFVFLIWGHVRVVSAFESERWFCLQLRRSSGALPSVVFPPFGNKERFFLLFSPFFSTFNRKESPFPAPLSSDSRTDRSRSASGAEMLRSRPGITQRARSSSGGQR